MKKSRFTVGLLFALMVGLLSISFAATEADYKIGPGDVVKIAVYDHPDLETVARVDNEGQIIFPLVGAIKVGDLTTANASNAISKKLDGEYIVNPQVSIFVQEFRSNKVMLIGEVMRPGLYELSGPTTLLELVSRAGGLTKSAGGLATIRRAARENLPAGPDVNISVKDLLESGLDSVDITLMDGDTVTIAKAGTVYVTGMVNKPAAYSLEPDMTVIKAITKAGGFSMLAAQNKVKIIRKIDGQETILEHVSLYEKLSPEDVLVVPESFF